MQTQAVNSNLPVTVPQRTTTRGFDDMKSEDFFGLLIAELQNQDPLNPTDNQQLLSQMSTIRQMEQSSVLNETLLNLAGEQRFGATAGLIGHYVFGTVTSESGNSAEIEGIVIGVEFNDDGEARLELHNGKSLPAESVQLVTLVENLPPEIRERLGLTDNDNDDAPETNPTDPATDQTATGRSMRPDAWAKGAASAVDSTTWLLNQLFAPGMKVGV